MTMFEPNTYIIASAFATAALSATAVIWADRKEKAAKKDRDEWYEAYYRMVPKQNATIDDLRDLIDELEDTVSDLIASRSMLNERIGRALAQAAAHPNTRPGKIVDILRGRDKPKLDAGQKNFVKYMEDALKTTVRAYSTGKVGNLIKLMNPDGSTSHVPISTKPSFAEKIEVASGRHPLQRAQQYKDQDLGKGER